MTDQDADLRRFEVEIQIEGLRVACVEEVGCLLSAVFELWQQRLAGGKLIAFKMKQATRENLDKIRRYSTEYAFLTFEEELNAIGITDIDTLYYDFLIPAVCPFLREWGSWVSEHNDRGTGEGPAGALSELEKMIFSQVGHVPLQDLQEQWDSVMKTSGDILNASIKHREHVKNSLQKHRQSNHFWGDIENLTEELFQDSIKAAKNDTGPIRLKQRGTKAGEPKTLDYVFSWSYVTENLKKRVGLKNPRERSHLPKEEVDKLLDAARHCCTLLQVEYLTLKHRDGLTIREIAKKLGKKNHSAVHKSLKSAEAKIEKFRP